MSDLRYVGTAPWHQVVTKDDGTFQRSVTVSPGEVVKGLDKNAADKLSDPSVPRSLRSFVVANSDEDPYKDGYEEPYDDSSNPQATNLPKLDMGSTRPGGEPQFELTAEQKALNERQAKGAAKRAELGDETPNADPKQQTPKPKDDGK